MSDDDLHAVRDVTQDLATGLQRKVQKMAREVRDYQRKVARLDVEMKQRMSRARKSA